MNISVIGGGSWGTALTSILSKKNKINWWVRREKLATQIKNKKRNTKYLTNCTLNLKNIDITTNLETALNSCELIIVAVPSSFIEETFNSFSNLLKNKTLLSAVKGVIPGKLITPQKYFLGLQNTINYGVISGPCHAEEIAQKMKSYLTISTIHSFTNANLSKVFQSPFISVKLSNDVIGAEYAAIIKNIYAIMVGICSGLGYGDNFIAVLITACTNEMKRLLYRLDPKDRTVSRPEYLGDLLVTCYSPHSRNRMLGKTIGRGYSVENATAKMTMIAEGYSAAASLYKIIKKLKILKETNIINSAYKILHQEKEAKKEIKKLSSLIS
jgi:glycerol-3-phosphate dehydrogenase (NAD(P)+)